ncbi:MAG: efflux RND transporter periplasmic adaptor subunit [Pseudomonadota bacterium]
MRIGSIVLALALVAGLAYWFGYRDPDQRAALIARAGGETVAPDPEDLPMIEGQEEALRPVSVMVLEVAASETRQRLVVRGRTEANRTVHVPAETTGIMVSQPLRRGAEVAEGQVLCQLSSGTRQAQLREAEAQLARAQADFTAADRLSERGFGAETTRNARRAELQAAEAAVDLIEWDIEKLVIRAPFDGVLESDTSELGARLAPGETCATVIDLSVVKVVGYVGEDNVDGVDLGGEATARMINGREAPGQITFVSRMADEDTRTYLVEVTLTNQGDTLRDGMTAELLIDLPPVTAHLLPQSALTLDDNGRMGVRLAEAGQARFIPVTPIRDTVEGIWVSGLPETARVIVVGQEFVRDGRAIMPVPIKREDLG